MIDKKKELAARIASGIIASSIVFGAGSLIDRLFGFHPSENNSLPKEEPKRVVYSTNSPTPSIPRAIYPEDFKYYIEPGDNLISICQKFNIDRTWYLLLAHYNNITDPNFIRAGNIIFIPCEEKLVETSIEALNNNQPLISSYYHVIKEGDRLNTLCKEKYSNRGYFDYSLGYFNKITNPNNIPVNTIIYLLSEQEMENYHHTYYEEIQNYKSQFENNDSKII